MTRIRTTRRSWHPIALLLAAGLVVQVSPPAGAQLGLAPEAQSGWTAKPSVKALRHMVAAANPHAAEAGREMLRKGGSAVDAAIAAQLVLGLVEPQSSGLGGGAFLLSWDAATGQLMSYDGREAAPSRARPDRFLSGGRPIAFQLAVKSALSVGVPGTIRLIEHVHRKYGKLPWAELFEPALILARSGFAVSPRLHRLLASSDPDSFSVEARSYFFSADGKPWPIGYRLVNPAYAETLSAIAEGGAEAFYGSAIADAIVTTARVESTTAASISRDDLEGYRVIERPPLCVGYRMHSVCTMGPPSSAGHTLGQALRLVEPYDLGKGPGAAMAPGPLHVMVEALKLAFADRNWYLGDPQFVSIPDGLLAPAYLDERRKLISLGRSMQKAYPGTPPDAGSQALAPDAAAEAAGTSHISVIDAAGNAVAMTTTIEAAFGSGRWAAGFLLNNELTDFSFQPARDGRTIANRIEGGKRPRSSMTPTIVLDPSGKPLIVTGSAGGARIIGYVLKTIVGVIDWKLDAASVLALPNFGFRGSDFELEQPAVGGWGGLGQSVGALEIVSIALKLKPYGQTVSFDVLTSGTQVIVRRADGALEGAADPRREGAALGD